MNKKLTKLLLEAAGIESIKDTILNKKVVKLNYLGKIPGGPGERLVEPVCLGYSKKNKLVLRVWDIQGASHKVAMGRGSLPGWRLLRVDKIERYNPTDTIFSRPRPNYNSTGDNSMNSIILNAKFTLLNKAGGFLSNLKNKMTGKPIQENIKLAELLSEELSTRGKIIKKERVIEPYELILYRGFNANLDSLKTSGNNYIISPKKSQQGMLWFTHKFITNYDPIEYAKSHGSLLLTYPLKIKKHYDLITYENGDTIKEAPKEIRDSIDQTENQPFMCLYFEYCLELPDGWFFTYKNEKFIGTTNTLLIEPGLIEQIEEESD